MPKEEKKLTPLKEYELKQIHKFPNEKEVKLSHDINNAINAYQKQFKNNAFMNLFVE